MDFADSVRLDSAARARLVAEIQPEIPVTLAPETVSVRRARLPFYDAFHLYEIRDPATLPPVTRLVLRKPGRAVFADGSVGPFYRVNDEAPLKLTRGNALDYLRFFFHCVGFPGGGIQVVERFEELRLTRRPEARTRARLEAGIHRLRLREGDGKTPYRIQGSFLCRGMLVGARVEISRAGRVRIADERIHARDLPLRPAEAAVA